jgi:DNA adenine methylase
MTDIKRPAIRYHGGKWKLSPWLISHFPQHRTYVEPFGGGASVLLRKPRSYAEIYNDLDGEVVNLFRVLRDRGEELRAACWATPFSREEFKAAFFESTDPLEQARRTVVRSFFGFGSASVTEYKHNTTIGRPTTGFRANSNRSGTTPAHDWANYPDCLPEIIERLRGCVIENRDATAVIRHHDTAETLTYCDPPYVAETRDAGKDYAHEMTVDDHATLSATLHGVDGMVVMSGYACNLYDKELYADWRRFEKPAFADGARPRVEVVWLNPACCEALDRETSQQRMFA